MSKTTVKKPVASMYKPVRSLNKKVIVITDKQKEEAVKKAQTFMDTLKTDYSNRLNENIVKIRTLFAEISKTTNSKKRNDTIKSLFNITLEVKSEGGSFGFPLVSQIGDNLCRFIDSLSSVEAKDLEIVKLHLDMMDIIVEKGIKSIADSPENGEIMDGLAQIVTNRLSVLQEQKEA